MLLVLQNGKTKKKTCRKLSECHVYLVKTYVPIPFGIENHKSVLVELLLSKSTCANGYHHCKTSLPEPGLRFSASLNPVCKNGENF